MSQFPISTDNGIVEGVNYLLSGPSGLGQNFQGVSTDRTGYMTGNFRLPYTATAPIDTYIAPIACSTAEQTSSRTFKYTFTTPQATPPFTNGNNISGAGWTNDFYNGGSGVIGVADCTTTSVTIRTNTEYFNIATDNTGGTVSLNAFTTDSTQAWVSTDANARITVQGGQSSVFLSAQLVNTATTYTTTVPNTVVSYTVAVNRYIGVLNSDPTNPDFRFVYDATVAARTYDPITIVAAGTGDFDTVETIFTTVLDNPAPGYYWYILEIAYYAAVDPITINRVTLGFRNLTAQVIKR